MPLTILVAEDDPATRLAIVDYLEVSGYSIAVAENGSEALAKVDQCRPHLLIADINMPRMDGYQLVQALRQKPEFRLMPVIFLTALSQTEERVRGYQVGCDIYLPKPFELSELGAVVRSLLERSQIVQTQLVTSNWQAHSIAVDNNPSYSSSITTNVREEEDNTSIPLTRREQDVLKLLADGLSNGQIGEQLHLSPRTVEKHVSSLLRKTETSNRAELVRYVMAHHWID